MSTDVAEYTPDQMKLISSVIAKNATKEELQLFLYRAKIMGLDPLKPGQIHFVKYGNGPGTVIVGIDGFRSIANRTGKLSGINRGINKDEEGNVISAWAEVRRSDWDHPAREEVPFEEYNTGRGPWAKIPQTMLKKVAECAALRMAFPDDLGGVYSPEEMDQARSAVVADQPGVNDGNSNQFVGKILRGSFAGRYPREIDVSELRHQIDIIDKRVEKGLVMDEEQKYSYDLICDYIADFELRGINGTEEKE